LEIQIDIDSRHQTLYENINFRLDLASPPPFSIARPNQRYFAGVEILIFIVEIDVDGFVLDGDDVLYRSWRGRLILGRGMQSRRRMVNTTKKMMSSMVFFRWVIQVL